MSRLVKDLVPELQELFRQFAVKMADAKIPFIVTCTYRSQEEQDILYARGRTTQGPKVTWTKKSKHTDRTAFDIALLKGAKAHWDVKVSVNGNEVPDYIEAGEIGESVGLVWGGRWKSPDYVHFQLKEEK